MARLRRHPVQLPAAPLQHPARRRRQSQPRPPGHPRCGPRQREDHREQPDHAPRRPGSARGATAGGVRAVRARVPGRAPPAGRCHPDRAHPRRPAVAARPGRRPLPGGRPPGPHRQPHRGGQPAGLGRSAWPCSTSTTSRPTTTGTATRRGTGCSRRRPPPGRPSCARPNLLARSGGEEFSLLLPDCRLDKRHGDHRAAPHRPAGGTCSIGVAPGTAARAPTS